MIPCEGTLTHEFVQTLVLNALYTVHIAIARMLALVPEPSSHESDSQAINVSELYCVCLNGEVPHTRHKLHLVHSITCDILIFNHHLMLLAHFTIVSMSGSAGKNNGS